MFYRRKISLAKLCYNLQKQKIISFHHQKATYLLFETNRRFMVLPNFADHVVHQVHMVCLKVLFVLYCPYPVQCRRMADVLIFGKNGFHTVLHKHFSGYLNGFLFVCKELLHKITLFCIKIAEFELTHRPAGHAV